MIRKHKMVCTTLNYIEHFLILAFAITWCISLLAFSSLPGILIGIKSSAIGLSICAIAAGIKRSTSIITKNKKKDNKIILLAKSKWNSIEVLIYMVLIDSKISHGEFALLSIVLKEYEDVKEGIKNLKT